MKKTLLTIILTSSLLITTCTKEYSFDIKDINKRIVVNSIFCLDSIMKINLSEETDIYYNNHQPPYIDNSLIIINKDNKPVDTAYFTSNGDYYSHIKGELNHSYKINIKTDNNGEATAECTIPEPVIIADTRTSITYNSFGDNIYKIEVLFNDPPNKENYYLVTTITDVWNEITLPDGEIYSYTNSKAPVFSDQNLDGKQIGINFEVLYDPDHVSTYSSTIRILSITKESYKYFKSYNQQNECYNDLMELFMMGLQEPLPIYTNITGGLGFFIGYSISDFTIPVDNYSIR